MKIKESHTQLFNVAALFNKKRLKLTLYPINLAIAITATRRIAVPIAIPSFKGNNTL